MLTHAEKIKYMRTGKKVCATIAVIAFVFTAILLGKQSWVCVILAIVGILATIVAEQCGWNVKYLESQKDDKGA